MTPGEADRAESELTEAREALRGARALIDSRELRGATSRLYYAIFHAVRAALLVRGLHAKTHSGQITLFEQTFGREPLLGRLAELRGKADYGSDLSITDAEIIELSERGERLISRCSRYVAVAREAGPDEPDPAPDS